MHSSLWWMFGTAGVVLFLPTVPLVLQLLLLMPASLLRRRTERVELGRTGRRTAVVIPAHNEELLVGRCVSSLLASSSGEFRIYVIAHNCTDATAKAAEHAGATVLHLDDPLQRGKACALRFGFARALDEGAEAVVVVDADSLVSANFLERMQHCLTQGAAAAQCLYRVLPATPDASPTLAAIAFQGFNIVRPRGRQRLGLSVGIFGNGFGVQRETLEAVPYSADSVVEDLEYHLQLVRSRMRVHLVEDACVYGTMPLSADGSGTQRARWEGGRFLMMRRLPGRLLGEILKGRLRLFEPLLDVLSLPVTLGGFALLCMELLPFTWARVYATAGLVLLAVYFLLAAASGPRFMRAMGVLLRVPAYTVWKIAMLPKIFLASRPNASWVRTRRDQLTDFPGRPSVDALE